MFCRICGNELNDAAIICPKCGCAVEERIKPIEIKKTKVQSSDSSMMFKVFNYISVALIALTIMFFALSIIYAWIDVDIYKSSSFTGSSSYSARTSYFLNYSLSLLCLISSICAYGTGTTSFVLGFKPDNKEKRFLSDALYIIVNFLLCVAIFSVAA